MSFDGRGGVVEFYWCDLKKCEDLIRLKCGIGVCKYYEFCYYEF